MPFRKMFINTVPGYVEMLYAKYIAMVSRMDPLQMCRCALKLTKCSNGVIIICSTASSVVL